MNRLKAIESLMTDGEKRRLKRIWEPRVVAQPPSNAWMDMCVMPDGEIRHYGKLDGERVYIASRDGGLSWKTFDVDDRRAMCAGLQCPKSGRWVQSYWLAGEGGFQGSEMPTPPEGETGWQAALSDEGPGGKVTWVTVSDDDIRCPRTPLALSSGRVLIAANGNTFPMSPVVARSDDDGLTWRTTTLEPAPMHEISWPHQGVRWQNGACEPTIVEREDKSLLLIARTSQDVHYCYESFDGGETWTPPRPTALHGTLTMPTLLKLSSRATLFFFCNTQPLPEVNMDAVWPPLKQSEKEGRGEDVFTNRDACHVAISFDDGKTWRGFRELTLNPLRCAADFRTFGGSDEVLDKSVHQFQAVELPFGKVLVACGQHAACRKLMIFDPQWLLETAREEDLHLGLVNLSTQVYYKSVSGNKRTRSGHCAWNRTSGAILLPDPDGNYEEALFLQANPDPRLVSPLQGVVWNFPAAKKGEVIVRLRPGEEGLALALADRWFNPSDPYVGAFSPFQLTLYARECPEGAWSECRTAWDEAGCDVFLNERLLVHLKAAQEMPNGLCYLILQSAQRPGLGSGSYVKRLAMRATGA